MKRFKTKCFYYTFVFLLAETTRNKYIDSMLFLKNLVLHYIYEVTFVTRHILISIFVKGLGKYFTLFKLQLQLHFVRSMRNQNFRVFYELEDFYVALTFLVFCNLIGRTVYFYQGLPVLFNKLPERKHHFHG